MSGRRVEVHIDELVLHGFPPLDRHAVAAAVERGLAERLAARPPGAPVSADVRDAGRVDAPGSGDAGALGAGVAEQIAKALG